MKTQWAVQPANSRCTMRFRHCVSLPALTLTVLDKGQLDELMFHEGRPHQLWTGKKTSDNNHYTVKSARPVGAGMCTSMVSVCVSDGTHSMASSEQQPPQRLTDTQDGMKRWWVSPGSSLQTSTKVSRGSQPLREYTSSHRRTGEPRQRCHWTTLPEVHGGGRKWSRDTRRTFSSLSGFGGVRRAPVSKLKEEMK